MYLIYKETNDEEGLEFEFMLPYKEDKHNLDVQHFCQLLNNISARSEEVFKYIYVAGYDFIITGSSKGIYVLYKVVNNKIDRIIKVSSTDSEDIVNILNKEKTEPNTQYFGCWIIGALE